MDERDAPEDECIGRELGHFRIVARIGEGGMGVVYRAEDTGLGRPVALKVLRTDLLVDAERRARFLREARSAAAVRHPNIATVFEAGESGGVVFIAMELIEGQSLRELLDEGALSVPRAVDIAAAVASGLARAHEAGMIHRDLRPDNVMVNDDGVELLDFGVAKQFAPGGEHVGEPGLEPTVAALTREGWVLGTPGYMSPEQAQGEPVDPRTDIFALGVLLYEMLAGRPPFARASTAATLIALSRDAHAPLTDDNPGMPRALVALVDRCLAKRPEDRFPDVREVLSKLRELRDAREDRPAAIETAQTTAMRATAAGPRRAPIGIVVAVLACIVAAVVAIYLLTRGSGDDDPSGTKTDTGRLRAATTPSEGPAATMAGRDEDGPKAAPDADGPAAQPPVLRDRRLTANTPDNWVPTAVPIDAGRAFIFQDSEGIWGRTLDGGVPTKLPMPEKDHILMNDVFPDGRTLLIGTAGDDPGDLEVFDTLARTTRALPVRANLGVVSPSGDRVAFVNPNGVHVIGADGTNERVVANTSPGDRIADLAWSPDGVWLAFVRRQHDRDDVSSSLEPASSDGRQAHRLMHGHRFVML